VTTLSIYADHHFSPQDIKSITVEPDKNGLFKVTIILDDGNPATDRKIAELLTPSQVRQLFSDWGQELNMPLDAGEQIEKAIPPPPKPPRP